MRIQRALVPPYLAGLIIVVALFLVGNMTPREALDLSGGWEYRWSESDPWREIDFPSNPPGRGEQTDGRTLHLRRRLPPTLAVGSYLFIHSIDINAQFEINDETIYSWNYREGPEVAPFRGWPWHMIAMSREYGGAYLNVTVESSYRDIGLWGRIYLGSAAVLHRLFVLRDMGPLALTAAAVMIFLLALGASRVIGLRRGDGMIGGVLAALIVASASVPYARQLMLPYPLLWFYLESNAQFVVIVLAALVIRRLVEGPAVPALTVVAWLTGAGGIGLNLAALTGLAAPYVMLYMLDATYLLVFGMLILTLVGRVSPEQGRAIIGSFAIMSALLVVSLLSSYGVIPWLDSVSTIVAFQFVSLVLYLAAERYQENTNRLIDSEGSTSVELEKLGAFNERLLREKAILEQRIHTDPLTGLNNREFVLVSLEHAILNARVRYRRLTVAMIDIDHFKRVNDSFGHLIGDEVLRQFGAILRDSIPQGVIAGRFGGEEFVIVLPDRSIEGALEAVDALLSKLRETSWPHGRTLTASAGLAAYEGGTSRALLAEADRALYRAKHEGRDRVEWDRRRRVPGQMQ